jgi:hypothetical protein
MFEPRIVKVEEERGRGTRGGPYVYVVEGNELVHISEYALKVSQDKYRNEIVYELPVEKAKGRTIYCFDFSRSGGEFLYKCRIEDFQDGHPKTYEYFEPLDKKIHEIRNLKYRVRDPTLIALISEFDQLFISMADEIREYGREKGFGYSFMGHLARLENAFKNPEVYYFTFMSLPDDESRIRSLRNTRKWIYQLWVLKLLFECLKVSTFSYHMYEGKPYLWIEQGSDLSTCIGDTPFGELTFWLEFQPSRGAHMMSMFVGKRVAVRPDIVITKGHFERTKNFVDSGNLIDVLIECKEDPFDRWKGEIESQIFQYVRNFKPKLLIVASLKTVPESIKSYLQSQGIKIVDDLRPNSKSISVICDLIRGELGK